MSSVSRAFAALALVALGAALWSGLRLEAPAQEKGRAAPAAQWEYKVMGLDESNDKAEKELNKVSEDGWELVSTVGQVTSRGAGAGQGSPPIRTDARAVFKRVKR